MRKLFALIPALLDWSIKTISSVVTGTGTFLQTQWAQYNPLGQFMFILALLALGVDAGISWQYGASQTLFHAAGFALVAVAFCVLPDVAVQAKRAGNGGAAAGIALACVPLGLVAYQSHIGYSSAVRLGDMQQSGFKLAKLEDSRESLKSERTNIAMWRTQLEELKAKNKAHADKNGGWLTSVDPKAMQSQLDAMDMKIANEAKRVKCGTKCEDLKTQRGNLAALIANLKSENDLSEKIASTQAVIDTKTKVVADTGYHSSTVVNQTDTFAKLFNLVSMQMGWNAATAESAIRPTEVQRDVTNTAMAGTSSLAFMILAPVLMIAAGINRLPGVLALHKMPAKREDEDTHQERSEFTASSSGDASPAPSSAPAPRQTMPTIIHKHTTNTVQDLRARDMVAELAANFGRATAGYRQAA